MPTLRLAIGSEMTITVSSTDAVGFTGHLAELLLQNDQNQSESARLQRDAARTSYLDAVQSQVNDLNAAANATMSAAFVSAAFSITGGACEIGGAVAQFKADTNAAGLSPKDFSCDAIGLRQLVATETEHAKIWNAIGKTASELAKPTEMIGQSIAEHDQASAKRSEAAATQAQWQASEASTAIDKANKHSDSLLDVYQGIQRDQNQSNTSLIGRI